MEGKLKEQGVGIKHIKCVIVGDSTVGKTSMLIRFSTNEFPQPDKGMSCVYSPEKYHPTRILKLMIIIK